MEITHGLLYKLYVVEKKSTRSIASILGLKTAGAISHYLKKYNIKGRSAVESLGVTVDLKKLKSLYATGISAAEVAKKLNISSRTVIVQMKRHNIEIRAYKASINSRKQKPASLDPIWLCDQYVKNKRSIKSMAAEAKIGSRTLRNILVRNGIAVRAKLIDEIDLTWLRDQYETKNRTMDDIATEIGVGYSTVKKWLNYMKVNIRTPYAYGCRKISTPHKKLLIPLLDSLGIKHVTSHILPRLPEQKAGPYEIDEWLPDHNVFLELYGDYWHGKVEKCIKSDTKKRNLLLKHYPNVKLVVIWESELKEGTAKTKLAELCSLTHRQPVILKPAPDNAVKTQ